MAMADYGAIVIKDGRMINRDEWFQDMEREVGWSDNPKIRHKDCDFFTYEYPKASNCKECPKAKFSKLMMTDTEDPSCYRDMNIYNDLMTITDCHGEVLDYKATKFRVDGNMFAYIGDEELTIGFYKTGCYIIENKDIDNAISVSGFSFAEYHQKVKYVHIGRKAKIKITKVLSSVYMLHMYYKEHHYTVIYGYGIDPNLRTWDSIKVRYLGRLGSKKIDAILATKCKSKPKKIIVDDENSSIVVGPFDDPAEQLSKVYNVDLEAFNGCQSLHDYAEAMNDYYEFRKFVVIYNDEFSEMYRL